MISMVDGVSGKSFGWFNYDLIVFGVVEEYFNFIGGEECFWLGFEGG